MEAQVTNFTAPEVAARLRVSLDTLARWRCQGKGPSYVKLGGRVVYRETDLTAFEEGNVRSQTRPQA